MDASITYNNVVALIGPIIRSLAARPTFKSIRVLCKYFERALQSLPCPQSIHLGLKGLVMSRALYGLLTATPFRLPNDPVPAAVYTRADPNNDTLLTLTEQASVDANFICQKHYYQSMQNIERTCFTTLDSSIDEAFKISNNPAIVGWHACMNVR
jgi:hypothetical protein